MTRHLNRLWNYGVKGLLGTLIILFVFPVVCIVTSLGSLLIALTAILWYANCVRTRYGIYYETLILFSFYDSRMPLITLTLHAFMALIMDLDSPEPSRNRYLVIMEALVWNIGIQGCLQPIASLFVALLLCPIISFVILTGIERRIMNDVVG